MFLRSSSNASLVGVLHLPAALPRTSATSCRLCTSSGNMDSKQQTPSKSSEDIMSNSFGEGYATRSNEEGFGGGIYSVTQQLNKDGEENNDNSAAEYDKSQGSEVKEKERGRNQNEHGACN